MENKNAVALADKYIEQRHEMATAGLGDADNLHDSKTDTHPSIDFEGLVCIIPFMRLLERSIFSAAAERLGGVQRPSVQSEAVGSSRT